MYIVYSEVHTSNGIERWYYGCYSNRDRANEVALELGGAWPTYHCVIEASKAKDFDILNLPDELEELYN